MRRVSGKFSVPNNKMQELDNGKLFMSFFDVSAKASLGWMERQGKTETALKFQSAEIELIGC